MRTILTAALISSLAGLGQASHAQSILHTGASAIAAPALATVASAATHAHDGGGYMARTLHHPVPGGVAIVPAGTGASAPTVKYQGKQVMVVQDSDGQWIGIVGIDLKAETGRHEVVIEDGGSSRRAAFNVNHKEYASQHIKLKNRSHVSPGPEQLKRYEREHAEQIHAYANFRQQGPSNVILDAPVQGRTSSPFGLRRFFNGEERNAHSGLDFAVGRGTPVKAPADGVVTIVGDYFFNGKTVFIDHGQGFVTMYCHLDGIDVKKGQQIKRGDVLGRVGSTGRSTGPHLHWNVSLNGNRVDPAIFLRK